MSSPVWFSIPEFFGIRQDMDSRLLPFGTAYEAENVETSDGNLSVAKGCTKYIDSQIPRYNEYDLPRSLVIAHTKSGTDKIYVVSAKCIYVWDTTVTPNAWKACYKTGTTTPFTFANGLFLTYKQIDTLQMSIGTANVVLVCTGNNRIYKIIVEGSDADTVSVFGSSGQSSNVNANFAERYANRLFAAGDSTAPCRLYWSCVPGDGRTYEDWSMVDGSEDASGGFVEVNAEDGDPIIGITALSNQLLIFKRHSVWRLYGDRPSTFTLERVEKNSDMMSNRGVIVRHDVPYFLMPDGVYTYDGVGIVPLDGGTSHLKRFFQGQDGAVGDGVNRPKIDRSTCAFWNNRMYFSFRVGDSTQRGETGLIVFDTARGTYMLRAGVWFPDLVDLATSGSDILMLGELYVYKFESGNTYDGYDIDATWRTQWTDFGKKMNVHQVMAMYLQLLNDDVNISVAGDYADAGDSQHVKKTTERAGYTVARFRTDQSHYFRFSFTNQVGTRFAAFSIQGGVNIKALSELKE